MIKERLAKLREYMSEKNIDAYIIPSSDNHQSEYVGDHFKCREFISGFTGSAGTVVVTMEEAGLWTDGRYFIQAEKELEGSTIKLFKMGEEGVPTLRSIYMNL
ncbi:creatinase/Prolidase N-terminal domain protein [[Clostridium] sordellii ATCC 9714]|nr:creatinase/Prolidase N-terminal domain protein [[Clostridium] sordellii ATCC 9714] [Paeniclostridium sordellii ATCC 9714]